MGLSVSVRLWLLLQLALFSVGLGNLVVNVEHKFKGRHRSLPDYMAHDARRHLQPIDLHLGGTALPSKIGLYYTKIGIGSPSNYYYVQVDTGSDAFWVNCANCDKCPSKSGFGMDLTRYDPKKSSTSKMISCDHHFCTSTIISQVGGCSSGFSSCPYRIQYGDGSTTSGYFVKDHIHLETVFANLETKQMIETVIFGCGGKHSGELSGSESADVLDGILGLGPANMSLISQLAAAGKAKKMFAHCLDTTTGGGIFTIGEVVHPEITTIPLVPNRTHYSVALVSVEVGGEVLQISADSSDDDDENSREAILDSGTTLAYLPEDIHGPLMKKIAADNGIMKFSAAEDSFACFNYGGTSGSISEKFPIVKFHFDNSLTLTVGPGDYLFPLRDYTLCSGWLSTKTKGENGKPMILLGEMVLANKLVMYDLENQAIGWTEYNCSSTTTMVKNGDGAVYAVSPHDITAAASETTANASLLLLSILMLFNFIYTIN